MGVGSVSAETGYSAVDDFRFYLLESGVIKPHLGHDSGPEVLYDHITLANQSR